MIRKIVLSAVIGAMVMGTAACNTVRGVGEDLKSAADAVDRET